MRALRRHCLVVSLALIAFGSACKKEGGAGAGGGAGGAAGDDLNVVPADSDVVGNIDFAKLRSSAVFKDFGQKALANATQELSEFKQDCGFDPVETFKNASFGMKIIDSGKFRGSMVVHSSAPKDKLKACLEKAKPKAEAKGTTIKIEGDIAYISSSKQGEGYAALTFIGSDGVVALFNDTEWTKEKVDAALKGGGSIKSNAEFMGMVGSLKKDQTVWFWINGASKAAEQMKSMGLNAKAVYGSVNVTDGLAMDMRARMTSPDEAKAAAEAFKGQLAQAQMIFTKIDARADGADYRIDAELTGSQLKGLASMIGMGGGGGGAAPAPEPQAAPEPEAAPAPEAPAPAPAQ